ncbi:AMP-binding protein [Desulfovibrio subterraneus]|uniref:DVU_1553 family AMP-dependent CoA ligase n=1 Tax=Desulfovibrio subterraneus TaxID=2718620 RepID=UPI0022B890A6|nr:AMP-binding protein [Desulfovibrio subterraneus]WBF65984.1 AMP-binding protein [Desulfovibrio subterraneus]
MTNKGLGTGTGAGDGAGGGQSFYRGRIPHWEVFPMDRILMRRMGVASASGETPAGIPDLPDLPDGQAVEAWQMERLRETLQHAATHSPYYAARLKGMDAGVFRTPADLAMLPRSTADDIRNFGADMVCVSQDEIARVVTLDTSGTSGRPKRIFFGQDDLWRTTEFFTTGMQAVACAGDTVMALLPDERPSSVGRLLAQSVINMGARPLSGSMTRGAEALAVQAMEEWVNVVVGSPMHLRAFALGWKSLGYPAGLIHTVLLCWDAIPEAVVDLLHDILGCRVLTHWGMTETGLGGALACAEGRGMHLRETDLLVEVADPETGSLVPDGTWGEIVVTTLCRTAMPLVRYRTGDYGRILCGPCPCGSPLRRMDRTPGRLQDDIVLPAGGTGSVTVTDIGTDTGNGIGTEGTLRLIDLDEALLPLYGLAEYEAGWHEPPGYTTKNTAGHSTPELVEECVVPVLSIELFHAAGVAPDVLRAEAAQRLLASPVLGSLLAQGGVLLDMSCTPAKDMSMNHAKRRIRRLAASSLSETVPESRS